MISECWVSQEVYDRVRKSGNKCGSHRPPQLRWVSPVLTVLQKVHEVRQDGGQEHSRYKHHDGNIRPVDGGVSMFEGYVDQNSVHDDERWAGAYLQ